MEGKKKKAVRARTDIKLYIANLLRARATILARCKRSVGAVAC